MNNLQKDFLTYPLFICCGLFTASSFIIRQSAYGEHHSPYSQPN